MLVGYKLIVNKGWYIDIFSIFAPFYIAYIVFC